MVLVATDMGDCHENRRLQVGVGAIRESPLRPDSAAAGMVRHPPLRTLSSPYVASTRPLAIPNRAQRSEESIHAGGYLAHGLVTWRARCKFLRFLACGSE